MWRRPPGKEITQDDEDPTSSNSFQIQENGTVENEIIARLLYQVRDNRDQRERLFQRRIKEESSSATSDLVDPVNQTVQQIELSFCGTVFEDLLKSSDPESRHRLIKTRKGDEFFVPKMEKLTINVDAPTSSGALMSECLLAVGAIPSGTSSNIERAARREAHILARVAELKRQGLWSLNLLPLCVEPQRKTTHWDNLLKEVVYLAHEFKTERRFKKKIASKFARGAMKRWQELDKKEELALEKDKKNAMKSCSAVAKIIRDFWLKVDKVVDAKAKNVIEARKRRALNSQLTMLIDEADKLSSMVGDGLQISATPSLNSDDIDQEYSESDTSSDNEETIIREEKNFSLEDTTNEVNELQKESTVEFDDFLNSLPPEYLKMLTEKQKNDENVGKNVEPLPSRKVKQEEPPKIKDSIMSKRTELENLADEAMLFQPKGFSLKTTQIKTPVPPLMRGTLREYQIVGLDWLVTLYEKNLNGILADEMGLGKTIQTIALLAHLACSKFNWGPHLIIVPTSVILNWEMEFKRWCPALKIFTYYGSAKERKLKRKGWSKENAFHVCITSYKTVTTDIRIFKMKKWQYMVLDEAQNIKNFKSQRWQALLNVRSANRLLLTGTPLQNSLMELWSLMHFLMPELFASHDDFKEWFSNPLTDMMEGNVEYNAPLVRRLHQILRPFILRRLKGEVEKQLPKKTEKVIKCPLSKRQRYLYDDFMSERSTRESLKTGNMMSVLNIIMQLRKCCNHPNLFEPRPIVSPFSFRGASLPLPGCITEIVEEKIPSSFDLRERMLGWNTEGISYDVGVKECKDKNSKYPVAQEFFSYRHVRLFPPKTNDHKNSSHAAGIPKIPGFRLVRSIPDKLPTAVIPPQGSLQIVEVTSQNILGTKRRKRLTGMDEKTEGQSVSSELSQTSDNGVPIKRRKRKRDHDYKKRQLSTISRRKEKWNSFDLGFRELIPRGAVKRIFEENEYKKRFYQTPSSGMRPLLSNELRCLLRNEIRSSGAMQACDFITETIMAKRLDETVNEDLQRVRITVPNAFCYESRIMRSAGSSSFYYHNELLQREACRATFDDMMERDHNLIFNQQMLLPELRLIEYDCGKLQVLSQLLRQLYLYKHRVLIFTQMSRMLDVLQAFLSFHGYQYFRLDGSTGVEQRHAMMERFNTDERIFCFILSTRSGGVGINLTGADTVIFYDSDWNPTMDAQAQDRCHRIGQTRHVAVYRLISEKTIEENILKKAMQKRRLGEIAIDEAGFTPEFFKKPDNLRDLFEDETIKEVIPEEIAIPRDQQELNKAMAKCEDEQDALASRELQAEAKAEKAEFELIANGADLNQLDEATQDDDGYQELLKKLSPIECYAIRFLQDYKRSFYDSQIQEAEKELEQKNEETKARLKGLVTTMETGTEDDTMTFPADTIVNEVKKSTVISKRRQKIDPQSLKSTKGARNQSSKSVMPGKRRLSAQKLEIIKAPRTIERAKPARSLTSKVLATHSRTIQESSSSEEIKQSPTPPKRVNVKRFTAPLSNPIEEGVNRVGELPVEEIPSQSFVPDRYGRMPVSRIQISNEKFSPKTHVLSNIRPTTSGQKVVFSSTAQTTTLTSPTISSSTIVRRAPRQIYPIAQSSRLIRIATTHPSSSIQNNQNKLLLPVKLLTSPRQSGPKDNEANAVNQTSFGEYARPRLNLRRDLSKLD